MSENGADADVIVIGAGLSGLVATTLLLEQGRSVLLLEASDRPGGRIRSLRDAGTGDVLGDLGPTWVWPPYQPVVVKWLKRLGLATFPQFEAGNAALDYGPSAPVQFQALPGQHGIARICGGPAALVDALAAKLSDVVLRTGLAVTAVSVSDNGVAVDAAGTTYRAGRLIVAAPLRVAEHTISWSPALSDGLVQAIRNTPTWMSAHAKALVVYPSAFWRAAGLSGRISSRAGPLVEAHDISGESGLPSALFGFVGWPYETRAANADRLETEIIAQLVRCFGNDAAQPSHMHVEDWAADPYISTARDRAEAINHPDVGPAVLRQVHMTGRVAFAVAETSDVSPGLIEGALAAGERCAGQMCGAQG